MPRPPATLALLAAVLLAAACGGGSGGFVSETSGGDNDPVDRAAKAIVAADVNGDGISDVLEIPVPPTDGSEPAEPRCWLGDEGGLGTEASDRAYPTVDAIQSDLGRLYPDRILDDEGAHRAGGVPYAVMHMDDATAAEGDPVIDALRPQSGRVGALVGIRGSGLAARGEATTVSFDDLDARVILALPQFVLVIVPDAAPLGTVEVVVTRGTVGSAASPFEVVAAPTPHVDSVRPDPVVPGILAIVRGEHLGTPADDVSVSFGGVDAEHVLALGRKLFAEVPAGAISGRLIVTVNGIPSNGVQVEVRGELDAPTLTSVTPAAASAGSLVRLAGADLFVIGQRPTVSFGTAQASIFGRTRGGILAIVPTGANGDVTVTVGSRSSNGVAFELLERRDPAITKITPDSGARGDLITIEGTDLYDLRGLFREDGPSGLPLRLPRVTFGERRAFFAFPSERGLEVIVPFGAGTGVVDVVVALGDLRSNGVPFTLR